MMNPENRIPKTATASRRKNERGVILLLGTLSVPVLISMMGLGIDASVLYGIKSKLQLASDGAALASARALSIGLTTAEQADSARNNATNWFNKNFPTGEFGSSGTVVPQPLVFDDPTNALLRHVVVTASTNAPSFFMRYWGRVSTSISVRSEATRRDSVIMMVLDRSGSMQNSGSCQPMKDAAKQFTGMFAAGRDRIGMVTFNMASYVSSVPSTDFRTNLGYADSSSSPASGTGQIDAITCTGGTGTPEAMILGYNELYKTGLPGALNVVMLFTDGLPTALTLDFRGGVATQMGILENTTNCKDSTGVSLNSASNPRGNLSTNPPAWTTGMAMGTGSYLANVPTGPVAIVYADPQPLYLWGFKYVGTSNSATDAYVTGASGCTTTSGQDVTTAATTVANNINYYPTTDAFGNGLELPSYNTLNYSNGRIQETNANLRLAMLNATANAADRARTTRNLPDARSFPGVVIYCIGLGTGVNHALLQRVANDGAPGENNEYPAFTSTNSTQPTGNYVFANDATRLGPAFSQIASFILRLSQ